MSTQDMLTSLAQRIVTGMRRAAGRPTLARRIVRQALSVHSQDDSLPGPVAAESAPSNLPRKTVLLIDASPSMEETDLAPTRLHAAKQAAVCYVEASAATNPQDEIAVVAYGERARVVCPLTPCADAASLICAVDRIATRSWTNIYSALQAAERLLASTHAIQGYELSVVLLTDGQHNCRGCPKKIADYLKHCGVVIDVVGIGGTRSAVDESLLMDLASFRRDGTKMYRFITEPQRLVSHYRSMAQRLTR